MIRSKYLRADDYIGIASSMLLRLEKKGISRTEINELRDLAARHKHCGKVHWGSLSQVVEDTLAFINIKRSIDGRPPMGEDDLKAAIRSYLAKNREDPRSQELTDALNNVREKRLGLDKFQAYLPLSEGNGGLGKK
jgi:hypothetical protein